MNKIYIKLEIHKAGKIALLLNEQHNMVNRIRHLIPQGLANLLILNIEAIKLIFNNEFKKQGKIEK